MLARVFDKEKKKLLIKFLDILSVLTIIVLIVNFTIFSYILTFDEYIHHIYVSIYMLFLVALNFYLLRVKEFKFKFKLLEYYAAFLALYLIINFLDAIKSCPEVGIIYFIPYLIVVNIFYSNKKTYLIGIFIVFIIVLIYIIDSLFFNSLWSEKAKNKEVIDTYFIINLFICLFLSVFFTYINAYIKNYEKQNKISEDKVFHDDFSNELYEKIKTHLEQKKPYLDEDYTLTNLANELQSNVTYISKAINSIEGQNFHHLINHFRIKDLKDELHNNLILGKQNYTLEYYYTKFGFKNQSTFNKAFKKNTDATSSDYINSLKAKINSNL